MVPKQNCKTQQQNQEVTEQWTGIKVSVGVAPTSAGEVANRLSKKTRKTPLRVGIDTEEIREALHRTKVGGSGVGAVAMHIAEGNIRYRECWQLRHMPEEWARKIWAVWLVCE
jgi:hypothetical protein